VEQRAKIKQLKSQLLELDGTSGQTETSRQSFKDFNKTTVEASSTSSTLRLPT
jgi:hypothetical protein